MPSINLESYPKQTRNSVSLLQGPPRMLPIYGHLPWSLTPLSRHDCVCIHLFQKTRHPWKYLLSSLRMFLKHVGLDWNNDSTQRWPHKRLGNLWWYHQVPGISFQQPLPHFWAWRIWTLCYCLSSCFSFVVAGDAFMGGDAGVGVGGENGGKMGETAWRPLQTMPWAN